jgi:hypothetical protein
MFEVTWLPILVAGVLNVVLGMIWYHEKVFGASWMKCLNLSPEQQAAGKRKMIVSVIFAFLAAMVVAYVMNHFGIAWGVFDWIGAIELAFWCWLGFTAPTMLGMVLWEQKPFKYYAIVSGFWLVSFIMTAVVLVLLA